MVLSAQISLYPLRQERLSPVIEQLRERLAATGLQPVVGPMSTVVTGEADALFAALRDAFLQAAAAGHVVMTVTVSNACPVGIAPAMPWELFEKAAPGYTDWYTTRRGQRTDAAERALLAWLLSHFPSARSVLEVGCGTGHFTRWLAMQSLKVVGLDRSPEMLAEMQRRAADIPAVLSDAHCLPFGEGVIDLVAYVTALEFLDDPPRALAEAVRVAREGVILVVLNRWSLGGLSRRWGHQSRQPLLSQAQDWSLAALRTLVREAAARRLRRILWASALFPGCPSRVLAPIPVGEVIGLAAVLTSTPVGPHEEGQGKPMGALNPTSASQGG
jgi:ubiquinone/menaquinone biosynthesis C-methylase UbiE/uncharacterized protein YqgV (UPF0045/DUF77 family)